MTWFGLPGSGLGALNQDNSWSGARHVQEPGTLAAALTMAVSSFTAAVHPAAQAPLPADLGPRKDRSSEWGFPSPPPLSAVSKVPDGSEQVVPCPPRPMMDWHTKHRERCAVEGLFYRVARESRSHQYEGFSRGSRHIRLQWPTKQSISPGSATLNWARI